MKRLELPHRMADYLCPVNGLCDVYEWKTGKRIPEELIFYAKAGFQMISQKRADAPKMIFLGQGSIGKREYEFWKEIIGYEIMFGEGKCLRTTWKEICALLDREIPTILFGLDMFYLPYQQKFYQKQHILGHVVLMVGYDDENAYIHDNSKEGVQPVPLSNLEQAWAKSYIGISKKNTYFEIDSKCQNSSMLPKVKEKLPANSLLQKGTWAYVGSPSNAPERYFYWTSVDTNEVGAGQKIPVIISTADGKYYVSESTTANRTGSGPPYVAISGHLTQVDNKKIIAKGQEYDSLQKAYDAYEKELTEGNYQQYKNTLQ